MLFSAVVKDFFILAESKFSLSWDLSIKQYLCLYDFFPDRESYAAAVSRIFNDKAACYLKMGDCKQCVLECNESLKLIDNNLRALTQRGEAYETMEK